MADESGAIAGAVRQFLAFRLDEESFALDVAQIREILDRTHITRIPRMPAFMKGVINLRGAVVPVVDMRVKFDMGSVADTVDTCIIVVEVSLEGETAVIGALVDAVQEVFELDESEIEAPPRIGTKLDVDFIEGMGKREEGFLIVLDVDRIFSTSELAMVGTAVRVGMSEDESAVATEDEGDA